MPFVDITLLFFLFTYTIATYYMDAAVFVYAENPWEPTCR